MNVMCLCGLTLECVTLTHRTSCTPERNGAMLCNTCFLSFMVAIRNDRHLRDLGVLSDPVIGVSWENK